MQQRGRGGGGPLGTRGRSGSGRRAGPRPQPYNRNKFLQANFRFLVSDAADLRRHEADADLMLDWDDVVQACLPLCDLAVLVPRCHSVMLSGGCGMKPGPYHFVISTTGSVIRMQPS